MMTIEIKETPYATLEFNAQLCIHSRHCVLSRPDVFVPNVDGEWIYPEKATVEELMHLAKNCPSGAIKVTRKDNGTPELPPIVNLVRVLENGPLSITANAHINDKETVRATLCRCGQSKNKPYCDGSHHDANFQATGEPIVQDSKQLAARNGVVTFNPVPNGPLKVDGSLEVITGTGRTTNRVNQVFLCRCGHSANKPYCDGTHTKIGFIAD